jgi:hypothetical protein
MFDICAGYTVRYPAQDIRLDILKLVWYLSYFISEGRYNYSHAGWLVMN